LTQRRPTDEQIGVTLTRLHFLAKVDPGVYHALRRITDAMVELHCRLADGNYHNALRPTDPDSTGVTSGTHEPDEAMFTRAIEPHPEREQARSQHTNAADKCSKLAGQLEVICGWADPPKGLVDQHGRQRIQSIGPDGQRRVG
jgi:hypothetical protein